MRPGALVTRAAVLALGVATTVLAQDPGFVLQGEGGPPSTLYAATHMGVIKSTDAGAKWTALHLAGAPPEEQAATPKPRLPIRSTKPPVPATGAEGKPALPQLPVIPRPG